MRIVQPADGIQQPLDHELLIEDRQLYGDARQIAKWLAGSVVRFFSLLVIKIDQHVAVHAVRSQQNENDEVGNQQRQVEAVGLVKSLESGVEKVLADVLPNAVLGRETWPKRRRSSVNRETAAK